MEGASEEGKYQFVHILHSERMSFHLPVHFAKDVWNFSTGSLKRILLARSTGALTARTVPLEMSIASGESEGFTTEQVVEMDSRGKQGRFYWLSAQIYFPQRWRLRGWSRRRMSHRINRWKQKHVFNIKQHFVFCLMLLFASKALPDTAAAAITHVPTFS